MAFKGCTYIEFDVFQCTVKDLVQSLTVDSNTVSKHMSRTSVRHDVILAHDTPRIVADEDRRPAAVDGGENKRRLPGSPGNPNKLSNSAMKAFTTTGNCERSNFSGFRGEKKNTTYRCSERVCESFSRRISRLE